MAVSRTLKEDRALGAATEVFTRYGYARATMADIAAKAGMSRPALYLLFPDKDAVFARVIRAMDDCKLAEIGAALAELDSLRDKLLRACQDWGVHGVELAAMHPDAADLFDLRFPVVQEVFANFEALVVSLILHDVERSDFDVTAQDLARTLVYGMRGLREATSNGDEMRRLVRVQVDTLVRALRPGG